MTFKHLGAHKRGIQIDYRSDGFRLCRKNAIHIITKVLWLRLSVRT